MQAEELQSVIERVRQMERLMDDVLEAVRKMAESERECPEVVCDNVDIREKVKVLEEYLESGLWLKDYECDERGELPKDLKRGVLSEDGLYNLLCEVTKEHEVKTDESRINDNKVSVVEINRVIKSMSENYLEMSLDFVEKVFTESENVAEGKLVRNLVEEIRSKKYYVPELELIMVDEADSVIGYAMFSRFSIEGKYENQLLLLSPVAVKTELQRQHISKELIEFGFEKAEKLGYEAVLVEGNPKNYNARGFDASYHHGIIAGPDIHLPRLECLMVKELVPGALAEIKGVVDYSFYETLA